jgi:amino acid adenylation domain-containing protein
MPDRLVAWEPDGALEHGFETAEPESLGARPRPGEPMYVMFTSGSTGEPRAILSSHEALHQFIVWETAELGAVAGVRVSNLALNTFDVSLRDIFLPLAVGGVVCVPPHEARREAPALAAWIEAAGIEVAHVVPSLFRQVLKVLEERPRPMPRLAHLLFAGEILWGADVERARRALGIGVRLRNLYGPSETTLAKCCLVIGDDPVDATRAMPVGWPLPGVRVLMIKDGRHAAPGAIGEIYIAPSFTPLGYFRDAELTAERFVVCPPEWGGAGTLYRTGDLGRMLADGMIEVRGRLDGQVKVNGVRVELAEIEQAAMANDEIDQAVAVVHKRGDGDNALVCYYTEKQSLEPTELRRRLALELPRGVIPHFFLRLDAFPLNLNGKVDRRVLPKPEELISDRIPLVPPHGPTEERIAAIWAEVLGLKRVGAISPFFEIGGDSLRAIRVLTRVNHEFAGELTISGFFERPTIRDMAEALRPAPPIGGGRIPAIAPETDHAVSHAQRRMWVLAQLGGNPAAYTLPGAYLLDGPLDADALVSALEALSARHEALRTVFVAVDHAPRQRILAESGFRVDRIDLTTASDPLAAATELAARHANHRFDLAQGPLLAASLLLLGPSLHALLVNVHHIVSDAWSVTVMVEEILRLARGERLPALRIHYKDYAAWEAAELSSRKAHAERNWWLRQLAGRLDRLDLPSDRSPPSLPSYDGDRVSVALDGADIEALRRGTRAGRGTLFAGLLAIVAALLHRYTGQREMIVGTPVACRDDPELESQVGFYVNTLPLRLEVEGADPFATLFARVGDALSAAIDHRFYPFDLLVDELDLPHDGGRPPLFDVMVVFQDAGQRSFLLDGITVTPFSGEPKVAKFPLTFEFVETATRTTLHLEYATDLFDRGRIERMAAHFGQLLAAAVAAAPERPLAALEFLSAAERKLLRGSGAVADPPADATVPGVFATQVAAGPERLAVIHEETRLTYAELDGRANALAEALADLGVGRGEIVGVLLDRSERLAIVFLGILKRGAVYLPFDPTYPAERINYMLADSAAKLIVTESAYAEGLAARGHQTLDVEGLGAKPAPPPGAPEPGDLAYLIYTSGSTGRPKGVLLEHLGAANLALAQRHELGILPRHRVLQFAPSSFDASVWEMIMAFLNGACLVVAGPERIRDPQVFAAFLAEHQVTVATLPPAYLAELDDAALAPLELLVTAGESPNRDRALQLARRLTYVNAYGPTETTVCATWHRVDQARDRDRPIPIGQAILNTEVLVLDAAGDLAPIGVKGEIHIGGRGLARGYLGRPAMTEAAFVAHPFAPGKRLYRTGDQGLVEPDGAVRYLGRTDRQVKLLGRRIELGEIERTIARHPSVAEVVVSLYRRPTGDSLVAYVVPDGALAIEALRTEFVQWLPSSMAPAIWMTLDALPLLPNGKIDYAALPDPVTKDAEPIGLNDPMEAAVAQVWGAVLPRAEFGRHDRFFEVGGDSIRAIQVVGRLRAAGHRIEMRDFLSAPTIAALASRLAAVKPVRIEPAPATPYGALRAEEVEALFSDD